eukprot:Pgem_evm1s12214
MLLKKSNFNLIGILGLIFVVLVLYSQQGENVNVNNNTIKIRGRIVNGHENHNKGDIDEFFDYKEKNTK